MVRSPHLGQTIPKTQWAGPDENGTRGGKEKKNEGGAKIIEWPLTVVLNKRQIKKMRDKTITGETPPFRGNVTKGKSKEHCI